MTVIVHGLDELAAGLQAQVAQLQGPEVKRALNNAVYAGAAKARDVIRARAPVQEDSKHGPKPGTLRKAVTAGRQRATGGTIASAGVYVKPAGFYWRFLELGTVKMRPHPFIRPAFDANEEVIGKVVADKLSSEIDKALARR